MTDTEIKEELIIMRLVINTMMEEKKARKSNVPEWKINYNEGFVSASELHIRSIDELIAKIEGRE